MDASRVLSLANALAAHGATPDRTGSDQIKDITRELGNALAAYNRDHKAYRAELFALPAQSKSVAE